MPFLPDKALNNKTERKKVEISFLVVLHSSSCATVTFDPSSDPWCGFISQRTQVHSSANLPRRGELKLEVTAVQGAIMEKAPSAGGGGGGGASHETKELDSNDAVVTRFTVDLSVLRNNIKIFRTFVSPAKLCFVIKSNAYGCGSERVAAVADSMDVDAFSVSDNVDAQNIRKVSKKRIVRCRVGLEGEVREALELGMEEMVGSLADMEMLNGLGKEHNLQLPVHINLDCGMGRQGFSVASDAAAVFQQPHLKVVGLMTHFPSADDEDFSSTEEDMKRFSAALTELKALLPGDALEGVTVHVGNSAATIRGKPKYHMDMVRTGAVLFGRPSSLGGEPLPAGIQPVARWTTTLTQIRTLEEGTTVGFNRAYAVSDGAKRIGCIPIGFGLGLPRSFKNKGVVLVRGVECPMVGNISLEITNIDVSNCPEAAVGDEVVVIGDGVPSDALVEECFVTQPELQIRVGSHFEPHYVGE